MTSFGYLLYRTARLSLDERKVLLKVEVGGTASKTTNWWFLISCTGSIEVNLQGLLFYSVPFNLWSYDIANRTG
jgi:hypothetical protein